MYDFDRYGRQARDILRFAHIAATEAKADAINIEHVLLGLAWVAPDLLERFLNESGSVDFIVRQLCCDVPRMTGPGAGAPQVGFSMEVVRVLQLAAEEAASSEVSPAHIMLAILREQGRAVDLLRSQGVDVVQVERFVRSAR